MSLKQLTDLIMQLRSAPPRPLVIWFVDRPAEFHNLLRTAGDELNHLAFPYRFYGIPMHQFNPYVATQEELERRPYFCTLSGIWVEMSDGNHVRLQDDNS